MGGSQSSVQYEPVYSQDGYGKDDDEAAKPRPPSFFREPTIGDRLDAFFGFDRVSADAVVTSCFITPAALLFVRVFMLIYAACIMAWHSLSVSSGTAWVTSMVSWTVMLSIAYFAVTVVLTSIKTAGGYASGSLLSDSIGLRAAYVMHHLAFTWSLATVVVFWLAPNGSTGAKTLSTTEMLQLVHLHGATLAFATIDLLLSRLRFDFSHYLVCATTALLYLLANAVFFSVTANPLHGFKWNSLFSVLLLFGVMFGVMVSFLVGAMLTTMRDVCYANNNHALAVVMPPHTVHDDEVLPWPKDKHGAAGEPCISV